MKRFLFTLVELLCMTLVCAYAQKPISRKNIKKENNSNKLQMTAENRKRIMSELEANMIRVDGGTFVMDAPTKVEETWGGSSKPHQVTLSPFFINKYEVTQELWQAVMGTNPSKHKGPRKPVERISYNDIQGFLNKLNKLTGKNYRLPTNAEWEFAARGGNKSKGYSYPGSDNLSLVGWFDENSGNKTHDVGTKKPNEIGIYDMAGNVEEWCYDWAGEYSTKPQTNPTGPTSGEYRISRGGFYCSSYHYCLVSCTSVSAPHDKGDHVGFRLACSDSH